MLYNIIILPFLMLICVVSKSYSVSIGDDPIITKIASTHNQTDVTKIENNSLDCVNNTDSSKCKDTNSPKNDASEDNIFGFNKGVLKRTLYLLAGSSGLCILYIIIKTCRVKISQSKIKKYGVITSHDNECTPLDQFHNDDDEDDNVMYDVNQR